MMRFRGLRVFNSVVVACALAILCDSATAAPPRSLPAGSPNILFIFIDDMGSVDLGCFGGKLAQTPQIDRLAAEGIRFTQFYVNAPICSPSRVAVTTGQYPSRWQITSYLDTRRDNRRRGIANWLDPKAPSLARVLSKAGYYTAHVGKWHMGGQRDVGDAPPISDYGFATSITNFEGLGERVLPVFEPRPDGRPLKHVPTQMSADLGGGPIHWIKRHEVSGFYVDRALQEIKTAVAKDQPFYINLWPDDVHSPVQAPPHMRGDGSPRHHYRGVLQELDRQLGRVFDYIRAEPSLKQNTIILLASDNGPEIGLGSAGELRAGKGALYEGGIRSSLIVWFSHIPDSAVGTKNDRTVLAGMDLPPSVLALANVPAAGDIRFDGLDMSEALLGKSAPKRDQPIMWVRPPDRPGPDNRWPDLAIREGDWKLLVSRAGSRAELYNIATDPTESNNLAETNPDLARRLTERVITWEKSIPSRPAD